MINILMDYTKHYDALIERAKQRVLTCYTEKHHVIPKCLGGNDTKENIVMLLPEEHYVAHQLLVKIYPSSKQLLYAALMMTVSSASVKRKNKAYKWLKEKYHLVCKERTGVKNPSYGKPWYHNPENGESGKFEEDQQPVGWVRGRVKKPKRYCIKCNTEINTSVAKWCNECRPKKTKSVIRSAKQKEKYSEADKIKALKENNGNIRQALYSLGLNDSGWHYRKMKDLLSKI